MEWQTPADARNAAAALARQVTSSGISHPDGRWDTLVDPALIAEIIEQLDPRVSFGPHRQPTSSWQHRERAFYAHLQKLLSPALYMQICIVLFDAIEQSRAP